MGNKKEKEMLEAIRNFHRVYYEADNAMTLHHAAEHLFDAAEITSSISPPGANEGYFEKAARGEKPPQDLKDAWDRILKG